MKFITQSYDFDTKIGIGIDNGLKGRSRRRNAVTLGSNPSFKKMHKAKQQLKAWLISTRARVKK